MLLSKVGAGIRNRLPGAEIATRYAADGTVPHVHLTIAVATPDGWVQVRIGVNMDCALSLITGPPASLRATVTWSVHVNATGVPGFLEKVVEDYIADEIDPAAFGGVPTGDRVFVLDTALPAIPLLGVFFRYDSIVAAEAGMTIGGAVVLAGLHEPPFDIKVFRLAGPTRIQLCSTNARRIASMWCRSAAVYPGSAWVA
jgi:hypothetical protein